MYVLTNAHYGSGAPIAIFSWEIYSLIRFKYVKFFDFNHMTHIIKLLL